MKKISLALLSLVFITACKTSINTNSTNKQKQTIVHIDLVNVVDDKVRVEMIPIGFTTETAIFNMPKTVPGTYSIDNYGKYLEDFKAFDVLGNELTVNQIDENSWKINNAKALAKISYLVNDTFDTENEVTESVFSPAGTNILKNKNFVLNLHGFVGYFTTQQELPYVLNITHPENLIGTSALVDLDEANNKDSFKLNRYFEVIDNPIMYAEPNNVTFSINGMEISLSVYSPNNTVKATDLKGDIEKMMQAQKTFLGDVNATPKYSILLYLSDGENDATGFGALEHHTSTTVIFPEKMPTKMLSKYLKDVVSHEFFHTLTPLEIHSEEVRYFDYTNPKMSKHLWMYEGVTEYFANLFQVNQGLIDNNAFYERMLGKINGAKRHNDNMSFTKMSANVLVEPYKAEYLNVYEKGALIGMCIDILIRENSNGEKGILDMMQALSKKYGADKPFKDNQLFSDIASITYPAITEFINKHVAGNTPINYTYFLNKVGLSIQSTENKTGYLMKDMQTPYISVDQKTKEVYFLPEINTFLTTLGVQGNDRLVSIDGIKYDLKNIQKLVMTSFNWKDGNDITMVVKRDNKKVTLKGKIITPMGTKYILTENDLPATDKRVVLRNAWLKN